MNGLSPEQIMSMARKTAVHLEMRDGYGRDNSRFRSWQAGNRPNPDDRASWWNSWHTAVAEAVSKGVKVRRARIISEPVSEYIHFEHGLTFANLASGEEVRWLPRRQASHLTLPGNDFWLIDDELVYWLHFSGEGEFLGGETTEQANLASLCAEAFEQVWQCAIPHEKYQIQ